jgi:hypothetical protein
MFSLFKSKTFDVELKPDQYEIDPVYNSVTGYPFSLKQEILDWVMTLKEAPERVADFKSGAKLLRFKNKDDAIICKMRFG